MLEGVLKDGLFHFELLVFDSGHLVLLDFVGPVTDELIVGEFVLGRFIPAPQTSEYLVGLGFRVDVLTFLLCWFVLSLTVLGRWCVFGCLFLLGLLLFLLFFLGPITVVFPLVLLLLVLG